MGTTGDIAALLATVVAVKGGQIMNFARGPGHWLAETTCPEK